MMYVRFPLSLRNVEDLLFERGICWPFLPRVQVSSFREIVPRVSLRGWFLDGRPAGHQRLRSSGLGVNALDLNCIAEAYHTNFASALLDHYDEVGEVQVPQSHRLAH